MNSHVVVVALYLSGIVETVQGFSFLKVDCRGGETRDVDKN